MDDDVHPTDRMATLQLLLEKLRSIRTKLPSDLRSDIGEQLDCMIAALKDELVSPPEN